MCRFRQLIPTYQSFQLGAALGVTRLALMVGILQHPLSGAQLPTDVEMRQVRPKKVVDQISLHTVLSLKFQPGILTLTILCTFSF